MIKTDFHNDHLKTFFFSYLNNLCKILVLIELTVTVFPWSSICVFTLPERLASIAPRFQS